MLAVAAGRRRRNPGVPSIAAAAAHTRGLWLWDDGELARADALLTAGSRPLVHTSALEDLLISCSTGSLALTGRRGVTVRSMPARRVTVALTADTNGGTV